MQVAVAAVAAPMPVQTSLSLPAAPIPYSSAAAGSIPPRLQSPRPPHPAPTHGLQPALLPTAWQPAAVADKICSAPLAAQVEPVEPQPAASASPTGPVEAVRTQAP